MLLQHAFSMSFVEKLMKLFLQYLSSFGVILLQNAKLLPSPAKMV